IADDDIVWMPTAKMAEIDGLGRALRARGARPFVAACFHHAVPPDAALDPGTVAGLLARLGLRALDRAVAPRAPLVTATTAGLAGRLAPILGRAVPVLSLPHWYDPLPGEDATPPPLPPGAGPLVGLLGRPRPDKGLRAVPAILAAIRAAVPTARIVAQDYDRRYGVVPAYEAARAAGLVHSLAWPLPDAAFIGLVRALDLVLLPYQAHAFVDRVSGPFCFAAALGRPVAVTAGTWMAGEIAAGRAAGVAFPSLEPGPVAHAVARAVAELPVHAARAAALAPPWRRNDGARLLRELLERAAAAA
ncbi:MAG: hypothetical protein IT561_04745, partial [Alphaproteobacteria bacterium]|nr:hypothetical protein [Alphaproteobacteria bacterium]